MVIQDQAVAGSRVGEIEDGQLLRSEEEIAEVWRLGGLGHRQVAAMPLPGGLCDA